MVMVVNANDQVVPGLWRLVWDRKATRFGMDNLGNIPVFKLLGRAAHRTGTTLLCLKGHHLFRVYDRIYIL